MGIFDAWTGNALSGAADKNFAQYQQYQTDATNALNQGRKDSAAAFQSGIEAYAPLSDLGKKYSTGGTMLMNSLGLNGSEGNAAATSAFQTGPGYTFARDQANEATLRAANAAGFSGNALKDIDQYTVGYANQNYGDWQNKLSGLATLGTQATGQAAQGQQAGYNALGGMYYQSGNDQANIFGNATSGITNSNTQAANAATQASGNMWNGIFNLAGNAAKAYWGGGKA